MKMKKDIPIDGGYFDRPEIKKKLWLLLWGICILSLVLELFVHRHPHFEQENFFGFYALLGFVACSLCILAAKGLGLFLKAEVGYYDDDDAQ
ncbi:hypothetical protein ACUUL3_15020 [Thiovibrio sp. JS02]